MKKLTAVIFRGLSPSGNVLVLVMLVSAMLLSMRGSGQMVAVFENDHDFLWTQNNQCRSLFIVETDKESFNKLVSTAGTMPETFTFITKKLRKNKYQFSILFTHPTDPSYVKKVLLTLGIEQLKVNNRLFKLPDYDPVFE
ncbi:MAG: hypothetical protein IPN08_14325 [Bacteroidales bacterium]|nr:hypothetical protein [Bacteroidales bacterium]